MVKYYKKFYPSTKVVVGPETGQQHTLQFSSLNNVVGYYATDQEFIQNEFLRFMREQRYGISEISTEEFTRDYLDEKKNRTASGAKPWREELSRSASRQGTDPVAHLGSGSLQAALRANGSADIRRNNGANLTQIAPPAPQIQEQITLSDSVEAPAPAPPVKFVPTVGKRRTIKK